MHDNIYVYVYIYICVHMLLGSPIGLSAQQLFSVCCAHTNYAHEYRVVYVHGMCIWLYNDIIMLIERLSLLVCFHRIACVVKGPTCHNREMRTLNICPQRALIGGGRGRQRISDQSLPRGVQRRLL